MVETGGRPTADDIVTLDRAAVVSRLLAGVVHDVNNALLVISGTAEMLEDHPGSPDAVSQGLTRIRSRSARAAAAIADVLSFARGKPAEHGTVNLRELVNRAISLRTFSVKRAGLNMALTASEHENFVVDGRPVLLLQAVLDLLANAEQALAGQSGGTISVQLVRERNHIIIRVADDGPGVPAEHRLRIFEPLFTTRPREDSTGLGLAAARIIAQTHGGILVLEDTPSGASFAIHLAPA